MSVLKESDGKNSFGRSFGALVMFSMLAGWFLVGFGYWDSLPQGTETMMAIGIGGTYGVNKISTVLQKNGAKT